jgi:eukaryotic-like serine/threonine-protein kinase
MKLSESPVNPGGQLDHYRIDRMVARSDAATIFLAADLRNGSPVAIKIPRPEMESDPAFVDSFKREMEIGELLDHPGIIKVIADRDRTKLYMVMEWFEGKSLREILNEERKLAPERSVHIAAEISGALEYIHTRGIVHRDIRPENVMVGAGDRIKLIDFGGALKPGARRFTLTKLSQAIGTSEYVSPEELKGKRGDARSDIFSLGVMLYEMLTGKLPFQAGEPYDRILNYPIPPREIDPSISRQLQEVIYRALERDPRNRYASARDFARDLEHLDQVGIADRPELRDWKKKRGQKSRKYLLYAVLVLIPILIFGLLVYMARH